MTNPYGPWATAIDPGRNPQLSTFWRQRLTMLVPTSQTSPVLSRRNLLGLLAAAALLCAVPTFHAVPASAEQEKVAQEKGKDQGTGYRDQQFAQDVLSVHIYHLGYVKSSDLRRMVVPLLSKQGTVNEGDGDVINVQDREEVLQKIDRLVAKVDIRPLQIMIEVEIVQVGPNKGPRAEAGSSILDRAPNAHAVGKDRAMPNAAAASVSTVEEKPVKIASDAKTMYVDGGALEFIHAIERLAEVKVIASPRLLVVNKQPAELQLFGSHEVGTAGQSGMDSSRTPKSPSIETCLRLRPFVASNGKIRLETHFERRMENKNPIGIPADSNLAVMANTNLLIPDGKTVVFGGLADVEVAASTKGPPSASSTTKKELLVVLTPHIWKRPFSLNARDAKGDISPISDKRKKP